MREHFLRELLILQEEEQEQDRKQEQEEKQKQQQQQQQQPDKVDKRRVDVTFLAESGTTGRTLSGLFVACDTNLTHILLNDLKTPIGTQSSALLRHNDVIAITYR